MPDYPSATPLKTISQRANKNTYLPYNCNFCILNFSTRIERNEHTKQHFVQKQCNNCDKTLILIGDDWFEFKLHVDENINQKTGTQENHPSFLLDSIKIEETTICDNISENRNNEDTDNSSNLDDTIFNDEDVKSINIEDRPAADPVDDSFSMNRNTKSAHLSSRKEELPPKWEEKARPCTHCDKVFHSDHEYRNHLDNVHKIPYACGICDKVFNRKEERTKHLNEVHATGRFGCQLCKKTFARNRFLEDHTRIVHLGINFTCDICDKQITRKRGLISHMKRHTGIDIIKKNYKCDICKKSYSRKLLLAKHKKVVHEGKALYVCKTCGKSCLSKSNLNTHEKIHSDIKLFTCDFCGLVCRAKGTLMQHLNLHTGQKPYKCPTCGKGYPQLPQLDAHKRRHTREKKWICNIEGCDRGFINWTDRKRHRFTVHGVILENEMKHICQICSKVFPLKGMLKNHFKSH